MAKCITKRFKSHLLSPGKMFLFSTEWFGGISFPPHYISYGCISIQDQITEGGEVA